MVFGVIWGEMSNSFAASRAQLVFALCLPVAVLLGYLLAEPDFGNIVMVSLMIGILSVPILMYAYHPLLIIAWNSAISPFFLPGQPFLWMLIAFVGCGFAIINRLISPENRVVSAPSVNRPLFILFLVVLLTAYLRGGLGARSLGSSQYGGKGYFYVLASLVGYFALISQRLSKNRAQLMVALFFISGLTAFIPNLVYLAGSKLEFLFWIFPSTYAYEQAFGDWNVTSQFSRVYGLTIGSSCVYCWLFARYGLRGTFDLTKPFRVMLFALATVGTLFCGYRGFMLLLIITVVTQFCTEKLYRPRVLALLAGFGMVLAALTIQFAERMPLVVQRSIAFLPVPVNPAIRANVESSSNWRLQMWGDVLPDVPKYLLLGKGYKIDPGEMEMAMEESRRGYLGRTYAWALVTGAYHNGPLTLLMPFGLVGFLAFAWFAVGSIKYLYKQYKHGAPELQKINTFFFAYFVARLVFYTLIFGNFYSDLFYFTGIMGLSLSLNGPSTPEPAVEPVETMETEKAHEEAFGALAER